MQYIKTNSQLGDRLKNEMTNLYLLEDKGEYFNGLKVEFFFLTWDTKFKGHLGGSVG